MPSRDARFGADLHLLDDVNRRHGDRDPAKDLSTTRSATRGATRVDLATTSGVANLQQALLLRFLTPLGDMSPLGHPDYGSRLYTLIGELNDATNRNRAKLYVLQALQGEPRVKQVTSVTVTQNKRDRAQMDIDVRLTAIDADTPLNLVFGFSVAGRGTP